MRRVYFLLLLYSLAAREVFVSLLNSSDSPSCGTIDFPCQTLNYALTTTHDGDDVYIRALEIPYPCEIISLSWNLTLRGQFPLQFNYAFFDCDQGTLISINSLVGTALGVTISAMRIRTSVKSVFLNIQSSSAINFVNVSFEGSSSGLVAYSSQFLSLSLVDCTFSNFAETAFQLMAQGSSTQLEVLRTHFIGNYGQCMYVSQSASSLVMVVQDTIFDGCQTFGVGAALFIDGSAKNVDVLINHSTFGNGSAEITAGVAYLASMPGMTTTFAITNSLFVNMVSGCGTAVAFENKANNTWANVTIADCWFEKCEATHVLDGDGGALSIADNLEDMNVTIQVFIHGCTFSECSTLFGDGGAISYYQRSDANPTLKTFITIESCLFQECSALQGTGGALDINGGADVEFAPNETQGLTSRNWSRMTDITIRDTDFLGCSSEHGGAISASAGLMKIINASFLQNLAQLSGSAIAIDTTCTLQIWNSSLVEATPAILSRDMIASRSEGGVSLFRCNVQIGSGGTGLHVINPANDAYMDDFTLVGCAPGSDVHPKIHNDTSFIVLKINDQCPSTYDRFQILTYTGTVGCTACPEMTYSFTGGQIQGNTSKHIQCLACPFGTTCDNGNIASLSGVWVSTYLDQSGQPTLIVARCPDSYCTGIGLGDAACAPGRRGTLCGACVEGATQIWPSRKCIPQGCGAAWVWPVFFLCYLVYAGYFVVSSTTATRNMSVQLLTVYLQLVAHSLGQSDTYSELLRGIATVAGVAAFQLGGGESGLCLTPNLTSVHAIGVDLAASFVVALWLFLIFGARRLGRQIAAKTLSVTDPSLPLLEVDFAAPGDGASFGGALLRLLLFAHSALLTGVLRLVHCEHLESGVSVLFMDGNVTCYEWWQIAWFVPLGALLIFPIAIFRAPIFFFRSPRARAWFVSAWKPECQWWDSVILLHLEVSAIIWVFCRDPITKTYLLTLLAAAMCSINSYFCPFAPSQRWLSFNVLQMLLLGSLVILNILQTSSAVISSLGLTSKQLDNWDVLGFAKDMQAALVCAGLALIFISMGETFVEQLRLQSSRRHRKRSGSVNSR